MIKSMGEAKFLTPAPSNPQNQYVYRFNYITMSMQAVDVCKIWFESIQPLRICARVEKNVSVWIFF